VAQNTAEIYDPVADSFTATTSIPGCPAGTAPPTCTNNSGDALPAVCAGLPSTITSASESGTTVTITTTTLVNGLNDPGQVEVGGVSVAGYNGVFAVTGIAANTFTYTTTSGLAAGSGGVAIAEGTVQCGLVDSVATLLNDDTVLLTGGDYIAFLGQSSPQAFIFNPTGAAWGPTSAMNLPRELPGITKFSDGDVLVAGGLTGAAAGCVGLPAACTGAGTPNACCTGAGAGATCGATAIITNSSAEIYNPTAHTWTLTAGSSATPGAAGGMSVPRIASAELFKTGPDAGMAILAGGINAVTPSFPECSMVTGISQTTTTATDLFSESGGGTFTATGVLTQDRGGYGFAILNSGPHSGDLVVIGGECAPGGLASAAIGSSQSTFLCPAGGTPYYELYSQSGATWTAGTAAIASTPANAPASALLP
jgi:hypothetical protein